MAVLVSVIIPTFRRPQRAVDAVRSALAQRTEASFEIVVVDNDPAGAALAPMRALAESADVPIQVLHEPRAGVAHARNAAVRASKGAWIAFLDDDEIAPEAWLDEMLRVQSETQADVVFGPVATRLDETPADHADFYNAFFARNPGLPDGVTDRVFGCGCSLVSRAALEKASSGGDAFSTERNEIGGEDDLLFERMRATGAVFAWAREAFVWEIPEASRVSLRYTMKRAFAYGQGPAYKAWSEARPDWPRVAFWMVVGLGQMIVFVPAAMGAFLLRTRRRAFLYRRAVEAVGKVLWFPLFKLRFYGASQLKPANAAG